MRKEIYNLYRNRIILGNKRNLNYLRGRCQGSADSGKRRNPAEWPEDEEAGRADVHHYCHRPAWSCLSGQNPEAGAKGVSAAAGLL